MRLIQPALEIIRQNRRMYIILNVEFYGIVLLSMLYVISHPYLQENMLASVRQTFTQGPLIAVTGAYQSGSVIPAALLTFVINLLVGSFTSITLPSMLAPFTGIIVGLYRAVQWGTLYSPTDPSLVGPLLPHCVNMLLEGQAYVLAMLASAIHATAFLSPASVGEKSRLRGYVTGLKQTAQLYVLVIIILAVAAVYEALEVILLGPLFA